MLFFLHFSCKLGVKYCLEGPTVSELKIRWSLLKNVGAHVTKPKIAVFNVSLNVNLNSPSILCLKAFHLCEFGFLLSSESPNVQLHDFDLQLSRLILEIDFFLNFFCPLSQKGQCISWNSQWFIVSFLRQMVSNFVLKLIWEVSVVHLNQNIVDYNEFIYKFDLSLEVTVELNPKPNSDEIEDCHY